MKKTIAEIWKDVVEGKAVAINKDGCMLIGEVANEFSPFGDWKVCYLDKFRAYYLHGGQAEKVEFD